MVHDDAAELPAPTLLLLCNDNLVVMIGRPILLTDNIIVVGRTIFWRVRGGLYWLLVVRVSCTTNPNYVRPRCHSTFHVVIRFGLG